MINQFYIYIYIYIYIHVLYTCCIGRYNTDANVVNGLKNSSYTLTGEKSLEIDEVYAEKIKVKVYVN